ncbi:MAG: SDR family oxidoreductase [Alphaproteobacteria bacterium]|nr:MAG: SDR family oxidoreductase [Alphaproteobacteria bacterium]
MRELFCVGYGYSAQALGRRLLERGWSVSGTSRTPPGAPGRDAGGVEILAYDGTRHDAAVAERIARATHLLMSAPPGESGDPLLAHHAEDIASAPHLEWIGYLSTVGVYGNHDGVWISEDAALKATQKRGRWRIAAEKAWLELGRRSGKPVHVFRLAGIYGPGRSAIDKLQQGKARRIVKPGQVFNRIHVEDIAATLEASIARPSPGAIYNVADDEPAPPQDLIAYGAGLLGVDPPPGIAFEDADLTPMARSFYGENKRVANRRIREQLGVELAYPTYREGLKALAAARKRD